MFVLSVWLYLSSHHDVDNLLKIFLTYHIIKGEKKKNNPCDWKLFRQFDEQVCVSVLKFNEM